ncbi:MAG: glycogen-binding domain-containing protein [Gracilimonas sp.]
MIIISSLLPFSSMSQGVQATLMSEFRAGYSSNTYLNPFFSEWDRSYPSGFGLASTFGQLFWDKDRHKFELNGGYVYEPFFSNQTTWNGYLAYARYIGQISSKLNAGVNIGTSSFQSDFKRNLHWVQPYITWFPSAFTSVNFKTGSNFREYVGFQDSIDTKNRIDSYALEIESWVGVRWQVKGGVYGSLENIPAIHEGISTSLSVGHLFINGSRITTELQLLNYSSEATITIDEGGGPGGPFDPPTQTTETQSINDQIWRIKLEGSYPFTKNISAFAAAEHSNYRSSATETNIGDIQFSGGIRLFLNPALGAPERRKVSPDWQRQSNKYQVTVRYRNNGNLYLVGDFNEWEKPGIPLTEESNNKFKAILDLEPGMYEYRILLISGPDEEWLEFSNNASTVKDGFGGSNAFIIVE